MRSGGISAAWAARECVLCSANYMTPRDPHVLYETYLALGLPL